jgi:hypothetical protein
MTPGTGRSTRNAPIGIANTAPIKVRIKSGTFLVVDSPAGPTNPLEGLEVVRLGRNDARSGSRGLLGVATRNTEHDGD